MVACTPEVATAVLSLIRGMLPVVNVFFELGRKGTSLEEEGLEAFRLADMMHHTHLQSLEQLIACLDMINEAVRRVTGDIAATLYAVDERGNCFIATQNSAKHSTGLARGHRRSCDSSRPRRIAARAIG